MSTEYYMPLRDPDDNRYYPIGCFRTGALNNTGSVLVVAMHQKQMVPEHWLHNTFDQCQAHCNSLNERRELWLARTLRGD